MIRRFKKILRILIGICLYFPCFAQPNICANLPVGYIRGGDFDITIFDGSNFISDDYLCIPEKVAVARIGVINRSVLTTNSIRYIFGVDNTTQITPNLPLMTTRDIDGQSAGEFWIMQYGEEGGQKKLNCKKLEIDVSDRPKVLLTSCDKETVTLSIETQNPVSHYNINWADANTAKVNYATQAIKISHTYTTLPIDNVEVEAVYSNSTLNKSCKSVKVKVAIPQRIYIKTLETIELSGRLNANFLLSNPESKNLEVWKDGGIGNGFNKIGNSISASYNYFNLANEKHCFKLKYNKDGCEYESSPVCTIKPLVNNEIYGQIGLEWNSIDDQANYELSRAGSSSFILPNLSLPKYTDIDIACNANYIYRINGSFRDKLKRDIKIISHAEKVKANFSTIPPPKEAIFATILEDDRPQLTILDASGDLYYFIYRNTNGGAFQKVSEGKNPIFIDTEKTNQREFCYYLKYSDACNNLSNNSPQICTINLSSNENILNWNTPNNQPNTTISYEINQLNSQSTITTTSNEYTIVNPSQKTEEYQIKANIKWVINGKVYEAQSISNSLLLDFNAQLYIPNAFTPNNDGTNDIFEVKGKKTLITNFKMIVYNQWGGAIFESKDIEKGWDGMLEDGITSAPAGSYTVKIFYKDIFGFEHTNSFGISLIK